MPAAHPAAPHDLTAASSCVLSAAVRFGGGEELPSRVKVLGWGENIGRTTGARIVVGEPTLERLPQNQTAAACERVPLDYEHQSVNGHPNFKPAPREVAGFSTVEVVRGDGVYLSGIDYTPSGQRYAANYGDVSVHAFMDADGNLMLIRSVALTQYGDISGMEFTQAAAEAFAPFPALPPAASDASVSSVSPSPPPPPMDTNTPDPAPTDYRALLLSVLGLTETDGELTDEDIAAAVAKKAEAPDKPEAAEEVAMSARMETFEKRQLLFEARAAGKIVPLDDAAIAALPSAALSALIAGLPAGEVPTGPITQGAKPAASEVALSAVQSAAAKALGLSPEDYRAALT